MNEPARQPASREHGVERLAEIARDLRRDVIRLVAATGQGYVQQGLGAADLFATLYFAELRLDTADMDWEDRDRFILSTAHNTAVFYATLAARGLVSADAVANYCQDGSAFEINASERVGACVEATCGSLGQGLSVGIGMALSARRRSSTRRVYVLLGDGELQEGQVWEAAMMAATQKLENLCLIVDLNRMQVEGDVADVAAIDPVGDKWRAFRWSVQEVDGNDVTALLGAFEQARSVRNRPSCIIANTLVGRGVPELEGIMAHNLRLPPDVAAAALAALD
jgi:transketolase